MRCSADTLGSTFASRLRSRCASRPFGHRTYRLGAATAGSTQPNTKYRNHRYSADSAAEIAVTTAPLRVNSQKEMGLSARRAIPRMTTLALAPTAVRLPPRSVPRTRAHHRACGLAWPIDGSSWATIGAIVAAYGTLLMKPLNTNDTARINIVVSKACPPVAAVATFASWLTTPVLTRAPTMTNNPVKNSSVSHSTL